LSEALPGEIAASSVDAEGEPVFVFDDSRRLTGANRFFAGPAVVLSALGAAATNPDAQHGWASHVQAMAQALGWPAPRPFVHVAPPDVMLAFAAPLDALFTATEVNEWAWERSAEAVDGLPPGVTLVQPAFDALDAPVAHFRRLAQAEFSRPLARLRQTVLSHGLPWLEDDDTVSVGAGAGSVSFPRSVVPLAMDLPWARLHGVPTALITGSNGKTTTTRLVAAMAQAAGLTAGFCGTEGVVVGGVTVASGDYAGPAGARAVLRHLQVQVAVLETARGGILRRGLAMARADVAVVTNISADHFGEYGVHNERDIAQVKLVLAHALQPGGLLVLNADDKVLTEEAAQTPHAAQARQALFALDDAHAALVAFRTQGGTTCGLKEGRVSLYHLGQVVDLGRAADFPFTLQGAATVNIANALAAVLVATGLGLPAPAIAAALHRFGSQPWDNPGRLERRSHRGATILIDYAHNPDGLAQLLATARALQPRRLGLLLGQAGNRDDDAIAELARVAARFVPDQVVLKELPLMWRGRSAGEVPELLRRVLLAAGLPSPCVQQESDEWQAAQRLLAWAQAGDVVVLAVHTAAVREQIAALLKVGP
jgi:cyanophycin synthetase